MKNKKILISVPCSLLSEVDRACADEGVSRSEFIRNAVKKELKELKRRKTEEILKAGYIAMGDINLSLAEEGIDADNEQLLAYEQKLSESE
ncbi:MAG: ribbon-helix-helix protein, CopG family [Clostridia bacterium]|nr:ribbon-helix-helix protein, CopG family [Clostridia bacterium]